jgi:lipoprotein NlpI
MSMKLQPALTVSALLVAGVLVAGVAGTGRMLAGSSLKPTLTGHVFDKRQHERQARLAEVGRRFEQGVVMLQQRHYDFAVTAFHRVLELDPTLVEAHVNLGFALLGQGNAKAARDFFDGALAMKPMQTNAYYGLGLAYFELGQIEGAMGAMNTYVHLSPQEDVHRAKATQLVGEWRALLAREAGR